MPKLSVLRSVDLWIKGSVKSLTFLLRRDASSPRHLACLTDSFIQKYLHLCISLEGLLPLQNQQERGRYNIELSRLQFIGRASLSNFDCVSTFPHLTLRSPSSKISTASFYLFGMRLRECIFWYSTTHTQTSWHFLLYIFGKVAIHGVF